MNNQKYHRSSMKESIVMGISHGYRIKPLCKSEPRPLWSKTIEYYWDRKPNPKWYMPEDKKCKRCEKVANKS
tara:strand:- start:153 stop:368 length:216 start_codon:yes stop_codon:yes gene_type:complete